MKTNVRAPVRKSVWVGVGLSQANGNVWTGQFRSRVEYL